MNAEAPREAPRRESHPARTGTDLLFDERRERADEFGVGVRHLDPSQRHSQLARALLRLDVDVPADLEVIGDEADGTHEHVANAVRMERGEVIQDVGPEPRLAGRRLALVRERPVAEPCALGDEAGRLAELLVVRIALVEDARRQGVRREHDVRIGAAHTRCEEVDERLAGVPALDEAQLGTAGERGLELLAVAGDRQARVVRREDEADDDVRAGCRRCVGRVRDARSPVLHSGEHRQAELALERRARLLGDRVQRVVLLDAEPAVTRDEVVEVLGRDRAAAADVRVVRRHVGKPFGRAVRHEDDGGVHTRASTVRACTSSVRRVTTSGSVCGRIP